MLLGKKKGIQKVERVIVEITIGFLKRFNCLSNIFRHDRSLLLLVALSVARLVNINLKKNLPRKNYTSIILFIKIIILFLGNIEISAEIKKWSRYFYRQSIEEERSKLTTITTTSLNNRLSRRKRTS